MNNRDNIITQAEYIAAARSSNTLTQMWKKLRVSDRFLRDRGIDLETFHAMKKDDFLSTPKAIELANQSWARGQGIYFSRATLLSAASKSINIKQMSQILGCSQSALSRQIDINLFLELKWGAEERFDPRPFREEETTETEIPQRKRNPLFQNNMFAKFKISKTDLIQTPIQKR